MAAGGKAQRRTAKEKQGRAVLRMVALRQSETQISKAMAGSCGAMSGKVKAKQCEV